MIGESNFISSGVKNAFDKAINVFGEENIIVISSLLEEIEHKYQMEQDR